MDITKARTSASNLQKLYYVPLPDLPFFSIFLLRFQILEVIKNHKADNNKQGFAGWDLESIEKLTYRLVYFYDYCRARSIHSRNYKDFQSDERV